MKPAMPVAPSLHDTVASASLGLARKLIAGGADLDLLNEYRNTPLMEAILNARIELACFFIQSGADLDCRNYTGDTALHMVVDESFFSGSRSSSWSLLLLLLLSKGAKPVLDSFGQTPSLRNKKNPHNGKKQYAAQYHWDLLMYEARFWGVDEDNYVSVIGNFVKGMSSFSLSFDFSFDDFLRGKGIEYHPEMSHPFESSLENKQHDPLSKEESLKTAKEILYLGVKTGNEVVIRGVLDNFPEKKDLGSMIMREEGLDCWTYSSLDVLFALLLKHIKKIKFKKLRSLVLCLLTKGQDLNQTRMLGWRLNLSLITRCFERHFRALVNRVLKNECVNHDGQRCYLFFMQVLLESVVRLDLYYDGDMNQLLIGLFPLSAKYDSMSPSISMLEDFKKVAELLFCHGAGYDCNFKQEVEKIQEAYSSCETIKKLATFLDELNTPDPNNAIDTALKMVLSKQNKRLLEKGMKWGAVLWVDGVYTSFQKLLDSFKKHPLTSFSKHRLSYLSQRMWCFFTPELMECLKRKTILTGGVDDWDISENELARIRELMGVLYQADSGLDAAMAMGAADNFKEGFEARASLSIQKIARGYLVRKSLFKSGGGGGVKSDYLEKPSGGDGGAKFE